MILSRKLVCESTGSPPIPGSIFWAAMVLLFVRKRLAAGSGGLPALGLAARRGRARDRLHPLQVAVRPDPHQRDHQDGREDEELDERDPREGEAVLRPAAVDGDDRQREGDVDLEDHEREGDEVEPRVEVEPGHPDGALTTLVGGRLLGVRDLRTEQPRRRNRAEGEANRDHGEHEHGTKVETHVGSFLWTYPVAKTGERRRESTEGNPVVKGRKAV